jgi:chromosome segregation ATPase
MKELNDKLQQEENELKDTKEKFAAYRDEMTDTEVRIESLALDFEMAEEKVFCLNFNSSFTMICF